MRWSNPCRKEASAPPPIFQFFEFLSDLWTSASFKFKNARTKPYFKYDFDLSAGNERLFSGSDKTQNWRSSKLPSYSLSACLNRGFEFPMNFEKLNN